MLEVNIEKIIPVTEARDMFNKIVDEVEGTDELYVLTKNGKPAAVVVGVNHLEKLTGAGSDAVVTQIEDLSTGGNDSDNSFSAAAPVGEESQTVFASAEDANPSVPSAATTPAPSLTLDEISAQDDSALAEPSAPVATSNLNPTAPSTESLGTVDKISTVPEGFGSTFPSSTPTAAPISPSQLRPEDEDSVINPDVNAAGEMDEDPFATINPNTPATTQFAEEAPVEEADNAAGPVIPPAQG